jgi:hypothetical protein
MMRAELQTLEKTSWPPRPAVAAAITLLILALGISLFLSVAVQSAGGTILRHDFRLEWRFFLIWATAFAVLYFLWRVGSRREAVRSGLSLETSKRRVLLSWLPLAALLITPYLLRFYWSQSDLRVRLRVLAFLVIAAVVVLKQAGWRQTAGRRPLFLSRATERFAALPRSRRLLALFLASYLIYQLAGFILVAQDATFTGDEPFYLMTTTSLYKDGDINIANNYAQEDYFTFYSRKDFPRLRLGIYGREGRRGKGYIYPINLPGISVLMLPFYWLSRFFSGRWLTLILKTSLCLWASLLGLQLYLYARERWDNERLSLGLWALYSFSAPVLFYAIHLYPEIPVALLTLFIFRKMTGRAPLSLFSLVLCGVLLGLLPWLGLKYTFFFWPLFFISLYFLLKEHRAGARIAAFALPALAAMALFYVFVHDLYGTFSPIAVYEGVMTPGRAEAFKQALLGIPFRARLDSFLDYFLDQRDGLLLYSPAYFFAFLGLVELWRRRRRDFWCLLIVALPFLANYALFTHRQGASPQGRVLAPLSWVGAIALGEFFVRNRRQAFNWLAGAATAAGLAVAAALLAHPTFLYQPTTHEFTSRPGDLFVHLSNLRFFLPEFLPSFIKVDNTRYWPDYIWVAAVIALVAAYAAARREKPLPRAAPHLFVWAALAAAVFLWVLYPRTVLYPVKTIEYSPQRTLGFTAYPTAKGVIAKDTGDIYLHLPKSYTILFSSRSPLEKLRLEFGSDKGEYAVKLRLFDLPLLETRTSGGTQEVVLEPQAFYPLRSFYVYELGIRLDHLSEESMQLDPFRLQVTPWRK